MAFLTTWLGRSSGRLVIGALLLAVLVAAAGATRSSTPPPERRNVTVFLLSGQGLTSVEAEFEGEALQERTRTLLNEGPFTSMLDWEMGCTPAVVAVTGETSDGQALIIIDEVGRRQVVGKGVMTTAEFSRDCAFILYVKAFTLFLARVADGAPIASIPDVSSASWSHEGSQIVLGRRVELSSLNERYWLSVYDVASGELRDIIPPSQHDYYFRPHFSPDDNSVVFFAYEYPEGGTLSRIRLDTDAEVVRIARTKVSSWFFGAPVLPMMSERLIWSADGDTLVYDSRSNEGISELWAVEFSSAGEVFHSRKIGEGVPYQWLGDNDILAVDSTWFVRAEEPEIRRITW